MTPATTASFAASHRAARSLPSPGASTRAHCPTPNADSSARMDARILLLGHGTVDNLDDLPAFLANIRRGRPAPPELLHEIRRRYEMIGGSPLLRISRELAQNIESKMGQRVHLAMRFWHPFAKDVLREISEAGCTTLTM